MLFIKVLGMVIVCLLSGLFAEGMSEVLEFPPVPRRIALGLAIYMGAIGFFFVMGRI